MASSDGRTPPTQPLQSAGAGAADAAAGQNTPPRHRRSRVRRLLRLWFGSGRSEDHQSVANTEPVNDAIDLVDQAEAFKTLRIGDVMTPRADINAIELSTPLDEVVRRFVDSELTRMPIYRETLDDPLGVVHIKDIVRLLAPAPGADPASVQAPWREPVLHRLRREVLYVPASMRCADLLLRMRVARIHMALVIDEFGGVDGLVTMEDLVEAVVGEIGDEHDDEDQPDLVVRLGGVIEADARASLEELEAVLGVPLQPDELDEEVDTVAGLVVTLAGRVPQRGEVIVHPAGFEFEVVDADPRRIRRLRIRPPTPAQPHAGADTAA